jgi:hypothetical protein
LRLFKKVPPTLSCRASFLLSCRASFLLSCRASFLLSLRRTRKGELFRDPSSCARGDIPHPVIPRRASAEGPLASLGATKKGALPRHVKKRDPSLRSGRQKSRLGATALFCHFERSEKSPHPVMPLPLSCRAIARHPSHFVRDGVSRETPRLTPRGDKERGARSAEGPLGRSGRHPPPSGSSRGAQAPRDPSLALGATKKGDSGRQKRGRGSG